MSWWQWFLRHLFQELGISSGSSRAYDFWSGSGSDLGEVTIVGAIFTIWRRHNCHVQRCFRFGKYEVEGTEYRTCRKHHPRQRPRKNKTTVAMVHEAHRQARGLA